jgi:hypothetical protein
VTPAERNISERLHQLVLSQLEGAHSNDEQRELEQLLRDHPWAQEFYIEFIQDTASLRWWSANVPEICESREIVPLSSTGHSSPRSTRIALPLFAALATSVLVIIGVLQLSHLWERPPVADVEKPGTSQPSNFVPLAAPEAPPTSANLEGVAVVTRLRSVQWAQGAGNVPELSRLSVGQVLHFEQGEMELDFDQDVKLAVRGPANLEIRSATEVFSTSGVLSARVGKTGIGFTIVTPAGRITDLGTEFGVAVGDRGATDVAVFRGAVDLTYGPRASKFEPSMSRRLVQGQGLRLDSDGHMQRLVAIDDARFPNVDIAATSSGSRRPSIITDVRDNIRDGVDAKFYRIVPGGLREDVPAFVDREHQWNGIDAAGIPPILLGADYVMPFNGDKLLPKLNVTVTIGRPAKLFIFLSDIARVPKWLTKDFVKTDLRIGLDESAEFSNPAYRLATGPGEGINTKFSVWSREIPEPTTITLGSIQQGKRAWGFCMYGIAAVPLETGKGQQ